MTNIDPSKFIITTDLDSLQNDGYYTASVTIPGSVSIAAGSIVQYTADITISSGALANVRFQTSRDTSVDYVTGIQQAFTRTGTLLGSPASYGVFAYAYHTSATNLRVEAMANNGYGDPLTGQSGDETFSFKVRTYFDPF